MSKIVLISCVSKKRNYRTAAWDLYVSPLFKKNLQYAKSIGADKIFILSAKHGLLELNDKIGPYNKTLNKMSSEDIKEWANLVRSQIAKRANLNRDHFIFLAGERYRKHLMPHIPSYEVPMQGLGIGKQLKWLSDKIKNEQKLSYNSPVV